MIRLRNVYAHQWIWSRGMSSRQVSTLPFISSMVALLPAAVHFSTLSTHSDRFWLEGGDRVNTRPFGCVLGAEIRALIWHMIGTTTGGESKPSNVLPGPTDSYLSLQGYEWCKVKKILWHQFFACLLAAVTCHPWVSLVSFLFFFSLLPLQLNGMMLCLLQCRHIASQITWWFQHHWTDQTQDCQINHQQCPSQDWDLLVDQVCVHCVYPRLWALHFDRCPLARCGPQGSQGWRWVLQDCHDFTDPTDIQYILAILLPCRLASLVGLASARDYTCALLAQVLQGICDV